jgi:hypothetical protein
MKTNKQTNKRFVNYFKQVILLFGISFLLFNCEKEEEFKVIEEIENVIEKQESGIISKRITLDEFKNE